MQPIQLLLLSLFFLAADHEQNMPDSPVKTIAEGEMPALAKDGNENIHLVYGIGDSIMYTVSTDGGSSFTPPGLVDTLTDLVDYATRGPQIIATNNGVAIIAVNRQGNIFSYIKEQAGKWIKTGRVNDVDTTDKEGFLGLSGDGNSNSTLFAIWPDLRNDNRNKIYGAQSTDGGRTWNKNIMVYRSPDGTVCPCCKPSVMMDGNDVYIMFRNSLDGNRDLYVIRSKDAGLTFADAQKLGDGNWKLDGCPMDGGAISRTTQNVQTVWRRQDSIFSAVPGNREHFVATGKGCTIAAQDKNIVYAWVNEGKIEYKVNNNPKQIIGNGGSPVLQVINDQKFICVWTDNGIVKYQLIGI